MGKSKKRSFHLGINDRFSNLKREDAINLVVEMLKSGDNEVYNIITLFGLTAEEVLEGGATYEAMKSVEKLLK